MRLPVIILLAAGLAACSTQAVHKPAVTAEALAVAEPEQAVVPTSWRHAGISDATSGTPWWTSWNDVSMNALVEQAMQANPEIRIAEARLGEIEKIAAEADPGEQIVAQAALNAARNDANVVRQAAAHAIVSAYLDARMAENRQAILHLRMQMERELTETLHKRLIAGLGNAASLREQELAEVETRQAKTRVHQDHGQAVIRLAMLLGQPPVEFSLSSGIDPWVADLKTSIDTPAKIVERRPDVQAAWQRLLVASAVKVEEDDTSIGTQIDQSDASSGARDALYRKTVLAALQDAELAMAAWHGAGMELKAGRDALEIQSSQVANMLRMVNAGRSSRAELLKARLAENVAQETALAAAHARSVAFAALQLALARD
jgi:outer membrane protein TolC